MRLLGLLPSEKAQDVIFPLVQLTMIIRGLRLPTGFMSARRVLRPNPLAVQPLRFLWPARALCEWSVRIWRNHTINDHLFTRYAYCAEIFPQIHRFPWLQGKFSKSLATQIHAMAEVRDYFRAEARKANNCGV